MNKTWTFGHFLGIPLRLHLNWFIVAILVTWSLSVAYFPQEYPGWEKSVYWTVGVLTSILFFLSVLFHELGHAAVARRENVPVKSITLFIFGGVAHIAHEPETAGSEFRIVIAGPLASFILAGFFKLIELLPVVNPQLSSVAAYLCQINLILAAFNLLPGYPLDGGRVLRSIFWKWKKDYLPATRLAMNVGLFIALLFIAGGAGMMLKGSYFNGLWVAFIGWYLAITSRSSYQQTVADSAVIAEEAQKASVERANEYLPKPLPHSAASLPSKAGAYVSGYVFPGPNDQFDKP